MLCSLLQAQGQLSKRAEVRAALFCDQQLASPLGSTASWVSLSFLEGCCRHWGTLWLLPAWMAPSSSTAGQGSHRKVMQTLSCLHSTGQRGEAAGCEAKMIVTCFQLCLEQSPTVTFGLPLGVSTYKSNKPSFVLFCFVHHSLISYHLSPRSLFLCSPLV